MTKPKASAICRVCLKSKTKLRRKFISIFEKHNDCSISENINILTNINVQKGDGLPDKICPDCLLELDSAISFKNKCESSNTLLRTTLAYSKKPIQNEAEVLENHYFKVEEVKKEEPDQVFGDYLDIEFLDDGIDNEGYQPNEEYDQNTELSKGKKDILCRHKIEIKPECEVDQAIIDINELEVRKSRAIDLKLECNECGGSFKSKCKMRVHWKKHHLPETLICEVCKRAFKSFKAFNRHKKYKTLSCLSSPKVNIVGIGRSRMFHCKECSYNSKRFKDLLTHIVIHSGERPFGCNLCGKAFSQQSSLQGHQESVHKIDIKETTCQYCGKLLKGRRLIYKHLKAHTSRYQCDICKKTLKSKSSLIIHMVRHTGVKSYTCERCAKPFYTMAELCNHRRWLHEKGKHVYRCDLCSYTSFRSETLKKHRARHTDTNISCVICGMFSENAEKFREHQKRHFERKLKCPHCEKTYIDKKTLSKHVRKVHNCTFLQNRPIVRNDKPIKKEVLESPAIVLEPSFNMIEVEVEALPAS